ncbi:MAG: hypothetical protein GX201_05905 [Clostridiales bacterium]|nr:hypothetical protein [Clostridiales bacterium]
MDSFYDSESVARYLEYMAYLNTISFCLLSGCGITESIANKQSNYRDIKINVALYRKALPEYENKPENPYYFSSYLWKNKKTKKTITPLAQALSILCLNLSTRKIIDGSLRIKDGEEIAYFFAYSSVAQLNFMYDNLSKDDLLYSFKHKYDDYGNDELRIDDMSLKLLPQYYACEAAALTQNLIDTTESYLCLSPNSKKAIINLLPDLCHIAIKDALYTPSRILCQICDSLINIYEYTDFSKALVYNTINILGQELCERITSRGEILRLPEDSKISSFFTTLMSLSILSRLYLLCSFPNYLSSAFTLYDVLKNHWDDEQGIFLKSQDSTIEYSIKEIGALFSSLRNFRNCAKGTYIYDVDRMISASFKNLILKSGIFINQSYPILDEEKINLPKTINTSKKSPPVFLERIEYKISKSRFKIMDEYFHAERSLWACRQLL